MKPKNFASTPVRGYDNIPDKIIGIGFKIPCVHKELVNIGLSRLINTGHARSLRADVRGLILGVSDEDAEEFFQESLEKKFGVELVMVIQRDAMCSLLFDFSDITKVGTEDQKKKFLTEVQKLGFSMMGEKRNGEMLTNGSNWMEGRLHLQGPSLGYARPGLSSYEGSLHD